MSHNALQRMLKICNDALHPCQLDCWISSEIMFMLRYKILNLMNVMMVMIRVRQGK